MVRAVTAGGGRARLALWAALSLAVLAPVVLVRVPPWYDYHNWVFQARIIADMLGRGPDPASAVRAAYGVHWWPVPNVVTPLGIAALAMVAPPDLAGRIFVGGSLLAFAYAYAYLVRSVQGRPTALEFFALPWALGYFFAKGYTSYFVSLPLAFAGIGLLHRIGRRPGAAPTARELIALTALGAGAYLSHLLGWGVLMAALAVYGLEAAARGHVRSTLQLWATAVPALVMLVIYALIRAGGHHTATVLYAHAGLSNDKVISLFEPLLPFVRADPFTPPAPLFWANLAVLAALAIAVAANLARRAPARPLLITGAALAVLALAIPYADFGDLARPDERFVLPAMLIVVAALGLKPFSLVRAASLAAIIAAVVALHVVQDRRSSDGMAQIQQATRAAVPPDASLLSLTIQDGPTHGGCSRAQYQPTVGTTALRWVALDWLTHSASRNATLLETSVLHQRAPGGPGLTVDVVPSSAIAQQPRLAAQYARSYTYVELLGCPAAVAQAEAAFDRYYRIAATGEFYAILAARDPGVVAPPRS